MIRWINLAGAIAIAAPSAPSSPPFGQRPNRVADQRCSAKEDGDWCHVGERGKRSKPCFGLTAHLEDGDLRGRAVHARADTASPILGYIAPPFRGPYGTSVPVSFALLDGRDGWLLVEGASDDTSITEAHARPMYHGRGWIRGDRVGVGLQASKAFAQPDFASPIVVEANDWLDNGIAEIVGCDGTWVRARWHLNVLKPKRYVPTALIARRPDIVEGWATGVCNIMETTCDGLSGDPPSAR